MRLYDGQCGRIFKMEANYSLKKVYLDTSHELRLTLTEIPTPEAFFFSHMKKCGKE